MANEAQLNSILENVETWNHWRAETPNITINLRQANLSKTELSYVNLTQASLFQAKFRKANLAKANLSKADLSNANLSQANLQGANLRRINLTKADLVIANLRNSDLRRADLRRANLSKANLSHGRLSGTNLRGADLRHCKLVGATLVGANLTGTNLEKADLTGANLTGANLMGANLTHANLQDAVLINSQLRGIVWTETHIEGAQFKNNHGLTKEAQRTMGRQGAIFISEPRQIYHVLVITDNKGTRSIHLNANVYTLGRDTKAGIRIYDPSVSRQHAFLLRLYDAQKTSFYHLVDGDVDGNRSKNGIKVNRTPCRSQVLMTGDQIQIGKTILQYRMEELTLTELKQSQIPA